MIVVGVGASRGCPPEELAQLVDTTLEEAAKRHEDVAVLATVDLKADEPAITRLAAAHGWSLALHRAEQLAEVAVPSPSPVVARHVGTPSVAEAAALLSAGSPLLLVEKRRSPHATCALAAVAAERPQGT